MIRARCSPAGLPPPQDGDRRSWLARAGGVKSALLAVTVCASAIASCSDPAAGTLGNGRPDPNGNGGANPGNASGVAVDVPAGYQLHPVFRRITGTVYTNSVRDIFGLNDLVLSDNLPEDALINDFDNAVEQPVGSSHIQSYLTVAKKVADAALAPANAKRAATFPCGVTAPAADPVACANQIVPGLLRRLFRRAATPEEIQLHVGYVPKTATTTDAFTQGMSSAIQAALLSPHFLYLVELGAGPGNAALTNYEYAARLAYVLWSSAPDEDLLAKAESGEISKPAEIANQVKRMLADPRGQAFTLNFAGQWLGLRFLSKAAPDAKVFPEFDEPLRKAMSAETLAYFDEMRDKNLPLTDLVESDFTFVNERLAKHYGITGVKGDAMQRVTVTDGKRGGILSQAMVLTTTSAPDHTSIVKRGKWVLGKLMCQNLPPPPANVPPFTPVFDNGKTLREQFEAHRNNAACSSCHAVLDPVGFGLESYNAIGGARTTDNGKPIDTTGTLPGGKTFTNASEMTKILHDDERFTRCATSKLVMFGLGRTPEGDHEKESFETLMQTAGATKFQLADLVVQLAQSELFRTVRIVKE
jgi:hypothetical protein